MTEEIEEEQRTKPQPCLSMYVPFAAVIASIGGILFGYDIGIVSGALLQLKDVFSLTSFQQELVVSGVLIGAFCASFFGGNIVDAWGRKTGIVISCVFFIVGSLVLYFSVNFIMLIIGRIIVGFAVSLSVTSECTYISEISPPSRRGMMVSFNEVGITIGFLIAYFVNYLFISTYNGWKYMFGVAIIPAVLQVLGVGLMPSSHHYLLIKGKTDKARKVLRTLRNNRDTEEEIESIISSISEQKNRKYGDLFSSTSNMRGRMLLGMTLVFLQQFSGNANVLYYAPTVFQHFGYSSDASATLVSVGLGVVKVVATVITLLIVDKVGRRSLLLVGSLLMATSIIILGVVGTVNEAQIKANQRNIPLSHYNLVINVSDTELNQIILVIKNSTIQNDSTAESNLLNFNNDNVVMTVTGTTDYSSINATTTTDYKAIINDTVQLTESISMNDNTTESTQYSSTTNTIGESSQYRSTTNTIADSTQYSSTTDSTVESTQYTNINNSTAQSAEYVFINKTLNNTISSDCWYRLNFIEILANLSDNFNNTLYGFDPTIDNQTLINLLYNNNMTNFSNFVNCNNEEQDQAVNNDLRESMSFTTKIISVVSLMTFVCAYSISYGPVTWLVLSEIFPGSLRGRAVSVATCVNWGSNIVVSLTFLDILNAIGIGPTFITYGFICYGAALFIFFCVPETKNKSLEEINEELSKGMLRRDWKDSVVCRQRSYSMKSSSFTMQMKESPLQEKNTENGSSTDKVSDNLGHDFKNNKEFYEKF